MIKALIVGGSGFAGQYLTDYLLNKCKYSVAVTKTKNASFECEADSIYDMDLLDVKNVYNVVAASQPDMIFHLAAQSSVALSWRNPQLTADVNIKGTINLLEVIRELNVNPRILLIGSGEEYGYIPQSAVPIKECTALNPTNIYSATKACQEMLGIIYAKAYSMNIVMTRSFNHFGPRQLPRFVISDFCKQAAEIEKGIREPILYVGNISVKRDFLDVRDAIVAYELLIRKGIVGETYNVGSGTALAITDILNMILSLIDTKVEIKVDPEKMRPADIPIIEADITKLKQATGWKPLFSVESTLADTLNYWRRTI